MYFSLVSVMVAAALSVGKGRDKLFKLIFACFSSK